MASPFAHSDPPHSQLIYPCGQGADVSALGKNDFPMMQVGFYGEVPFTYSKLLLPDDIR